MIQTATQQPVQDDGQVTITNPRVFLSADDFRQLGCADSSGTTALNNPAETKRMIIAAIGPNSLRVESARMSLSTMNRHDPAQPYQMAVMATLLNIDWAQVYGLNGSNRHECMATLSQGRPQPSPIRPLLTYAVLRGGLRASPPGTDSPFDLRIWLSDIGFVARFIAIFYPSPEMTPADYTEIARTICADYRPTALASGLSLIQSLLSPHLKDETRQFLLTLAEALEHPSHFLTRPPATRLAEFEQALIAIPLAPDSVNRLRESLKAIRMCFESRKVERSQTVANHINSAPFLAALANEWRTSEQGIAYCLHDAYRHTGQRHEHLERRTLFWLITVGIAVLGVLLALGQLAFSMTDDPLRRWVIGTLQLLTGGCFLFGCGWCQRIRDTYGRHSHAKTLPGLHRLGFQRLLKCTFSEHALLRLRQLRQLYQDYNIPFNTTCFDQLEHWIADNTTLSLQDVASD